MIQTRQLEVKNSALASFLLNMRNPPETLRFRGKFSKKKQIAGIEPVSPAWEASVLPMNYICMTSYYNLNFPKNSRPKITLIWQL